jgi:hypothetical protein
MTRTFTSKAYTGCTTGVVVANLKGTLNQNTAPPTKLGSNCKVRCLARAPVTTCCGICRITQRYVLVSAGPDKCICTDTGTHDLLREGLEEMSPVGHLHAHAGVDHFEDNRVLIVCDCQYDLTKHGGIACIRQ